MKAVSARVQCTIRACVSSGVQHSIYVLGEHNQS